MFMIKFSWELATWSLLFSVLTFISCDSALSMQVCTVTLLWSKVIMLKPTASGTASRMDNTQIHMISTAVEDGIPTPCTRLHEATARYLPTTPYIFIFFCKACQIHSHFTCLMYVSYLSTLRAHRLSTVIPTEAFCRKGTSLQRKSPNTVSLNGHLIASSYNKKHNP